MIWDGDFQRYIKRVMERFNNQKYLQGFIIYTKYTIIPRIVDDFNEVTVSSH